jgi:hypothetical protein
LACNDLSIQFLQRFFIGILDSYGNLCRAIFPKVCGATAKSSTMDGMVFDFGKSLYCTMDAGLCGLV